MSRRPRAIPPIKALMTPFPYFIDLDAPLESAQEMMGPQQIRHLPVMSKGDLVGVVSEPAITRALEPRTGESPREGLLVRDVAQLEPHIVDLSAPADVVLSQMAQRHIDVAVVVKHGRLAGIFTMTDAYRGFADLLRTQFPNSSGGDEAA
ncbi:MAG: CBS domain-containing protein [Thermoanaerobaculia bacterium]